MSARFGTVARRLRIRYVLRRHGLMAAVMAAGSQARVWMRRCGVRT
jgi:hypothetical protein